MRGGRLVTLYSTIEQTDGTKVTLDGLNLKWEKSEKEEGYCDKINVYCSNGQESEFNEFTFNGDNVFQGRVTQGYTPFYAIFGGETVTTPSELPSYSDNPKALSFFIPQEKGPQVDNISGGCFPAVAAIENNAAKFHNVFGLLEVTFSGDGTNIKKIVLHDLAGNALWGTCNVAISKDNEGNTVFGEVEVINTESDANTISMTLSEAQSLNGKSVYFPVPAGALDDGFSIVLYEYDPSKADSENPQKDKVGRAYSFLQKITGTAAMPRSGILEVTANVTDKHEAFNVKERGFYKSLFVNAGMYLSNYYMPDYQDVNSEGIPAISDMGLDKDYEYFASHKTPDLTDSDLCKNDKDTQYSVLVQSDIDDNGVLLYPDGSPRFRMVYVNGGRSYSHGPSLRYDDNLNKPDGRYRFKAFFDNGGSYAASCAGSFLSGTSVDNINEFDNTNPSEGKPNYTFGIFPGNLCHTQLPLNIDNYPSIYTNMEIVSIPQGYSLDIESITEASYKYGLSSGTIITYPESTYTGIKDVFHHGGSYLPTKDSKNKGNDTDKNDTEVSNGTLTQLMKYRYSITKVGGDDDVNYYRSDNFHTPSAEHTTQGKTNINARFYGSAPVSVPGNTHLISTWAYKPQGNATGRAVCTGSHPEYTSRKCDIEFTRFMFQYALDGVGEARVKKTELSLGNVRVMGGSDPSTYNGGPEENNAGIGDGQYHHFKFETNAEIKNFVLRLDSGCDKDSGINLYLGLRKDDLAWLSDADYTLCNKGGQKELRIKHLPAGIWYVSVFCATKVEAEATHTFPKYFKYSGKTDVLNGIPYSIMINSGYTGTAGENAPASDYGTGSSIGNDFDNLTKFTPNVDD